MSKKKNIETKEEKTRRLVEAGKNTRFGSPGGPSTKRGGRKKTIKNVLKGEGFTGEDIREAGTILAFMKAADLKAVADDDTKPVIVRILGGALLQNLKKQNLRDVRELLEIVSPKTAPAGDGGPVEVVIRRETK